MRKRKLEVTWRIINNPTSASKSLVIWRDWRNWIPRTNCSRSDGDPSDLQKKSGAKIVGFRAGEWHQKNLQGSLRVQAARIEKRMRSDPRSGEKQGPDSQSAVVKLWKWHRLVIDTDEVANVIARLWGKVDPNAGLVVSLKTWERDSGTQW